MTSTLGLADSVGRDLRHSFRSLLRRPTFTLAAVLTLALGIGANTAVFSVVNAVLLKPLSYPQSNELVSLQHVAPAIIPARSGFRRIFTSPIATKTGPSSTSESSETAEPP